MMNCAQAFKLSGAVAVLLTAQMATAVPCGFHGALGDGFSAMHPKSIDVALAVRDAADAGVIEALQLKPKLADMLALHRATQRLERLREALQRVAHDAPPPAFSLLLVESGMWNSFTVEAGVVGLKVHADGPSSERATVITGDAVLTAIAAGKLAPRDAFRNGLIVVEGPPELARTLSAALSP